MKITTAWADNGYELWLVSAYDESTLDSFGHVSGFYTEAVDEAAEGSAIREIVLEVPDSVIEAQFKIPTVDATVIPGSDR